MKLDEDPLRLRAIKLKRAHDQNWRCCWCGGLMCDVPGCPNQVTLEHLVRRHDGGRSRPENLAAACRRCNSERHAEDDRGRGTVYATAGDDTPRSPFEVLKSG